MQFTKVLAVLATFSFVSVLLLVLSPLSTNKYLPQVLSASLPPRDPEVQLPEPDESALSERQPVISPVSSLYLEKINLAKLFFSRTGLLSAFRLQVSLGVMFKSACSTIFSTISFLIGTLLQIHAVMSGAIPILRQLPFAMELVSFLK
jgi:hypothetical protein